MNYERPNLAAKAVSLAAVATILLILALTAWYYTTRATPWTVYLGVGVIAAALVGRVLLLSTRRH